MQILIEAKPLSGTVVAPVSKSLLHRQLIAAALLPIDGPTTLKINDTNCASQSNADVPSCNAIDLPESLSALPDDILATINCLRALGATVEAERDTGALLVTPIPLHKTQAATQPVALFAEESGSTLRFLLPVACALYPCVDVDAAPGLRNRPLDDLITCLQENGVQFSSDTLPFTTTGTLQGNEFAISGKVSSQYVSGLLFAAAVKLAQNLIDSCKIRVTQSMVSCDYVQLTIDVLEQFGLHIEQNVIGEETILIVTKKSAIAIPHEFDCEGCWSSAAAWEVAKHFGNNVRIEGLYPRSHQGDRRIKNILNQMAGNNFSSDDLASNNFTSNDFANNNLASNNFTSNDLAGNDFTGGTLSDTIEIIEESPSIDMKNNPDLVPLVAVAAAFGPYARTPLAEPVTLTNVGRLSGKESDRLSGTVELLQAFGAQARAAEDALIVYPAPLCTLNPGTCIHFNPHHDHRMAMAAATALSAPQFVRAGISLEIEDAECVAKSYPAFFDEYLRLQQNYAASKSNFKSENWNETKRDLTQTGAQSKSQSRYSLKPKYAGLSPRRCYII